LTKMPEGELFFMQEIHEGAEERGSRISELVISLELEQGEIIEIT